MIPSTPDKSQVFVDERLNNPEDFMNHAWRHPDSANANCRNEIILRKKSAPTILIIKTNKCLRYFCEHICSRSAPFQTMATLFVLPLLLTNSAFPTAVNVYSTSCPATCPARVLILCLPCRRTAIRDTPITTIFWTYKSLRLLSDKTFIPMLWRIAPTSWELGISSTPKTHYTVRETICTLLIVIPEMCV